MNSGPKNGAAGQLLYQGVVVGGLRWEVRGGSDLTLGFGTRGQMLLGGCLEPCLLWPRCWRTEDRELELSGEYVHLGLGGVSEASVQFPPSQSLGL